jgi:pimeloyl-ACP methyl ester carboxylesterase
MDSRTVDLAGPVHYADFGGAGPPIVLVHGLGGSHLNWMAVGPRLARRARVVAPDLAGFGRTPPAGRSSGVEANAELLTRFLDRVAGKPAVLVGNSMGGAISMLVAARQPQRVAGLVLVDPAVPVPIGAPVDRRLLATFAAYALPLFGEWFTRRKAARLGPEGVVRELLELCCAEPARIGPGLWDAHVALARERMATMPWAPDALVEAGRSLGGMLRRPAALRAVIRAVRAPALVVHGALDRLVPLAACLALARLRPDWTVEVLEGVGHVPQLEVPERFTAVVEGWLERNALLAA